jgi:hypothetical protein
MARLASDADLRERIRRNVGYAHVAVRLHPPRTPAAPTRLTFGRQTGAPLTTATALDTTAKVLTAVLGHGYALTLSVLTGTREIAVTQKLGFPYVIRRATFGGNATIAEAFSARLLVSDDNDTTAVANPTGTDIIQPGGDVIGAEDPGIHGTWNSNPLVSEPWYVVPYPGTFIKLKIHNVAGATRTVSVWIDLDELTTEPP